MDEFNLSDYCTDNPLGLGEFGIPGVVYVHKVKEFIRLLKMPFLILEGEDPFRKFDERINKLAGDKLCI